MTDEKTLTPDRPADDQPGADPADRESFFDVETFKKLNKERRQAWEAMPEEDRKKITETVQRTITPITGEVARTIAPFTEATKFIRDFFNSEEWQNFRDAWAKLAEDAPEFLEDAKVWAGYAEDINELKQELEEELKKPEYGGKTIFELWDDAEDENGGMLAGSLFEQAMTAARAARTTDIKTATIRPAEKIDFPLDKINSKAWKLLEQDTSGQIAFNMAKRGSKQDLPVYYAINFDDLGNDIKITKRLLPFDKRVYIAIAALFNAGNNVITLAQIYKHMGYKGKAGASDLGKINKSILKMLGAQIYLSNELEANQYKGYSRFIYRGSLLPLETSEVYNIQGALTDAAIHIFREPPLITFARQRKQITTVNLKLLQSPINKTDANLLIDDYLIERISKAKNGKGRKCRILFKTLYDHVGIPDKPKTNTEKQQKKRAPEKVEKYLKHYQKEEFIKSFSMEKDGVTIYW